MQVYVDLALNTPHVSVFRDLGDVITEMMLPPDAQLIAARLAGKGSALYGDLKRTKRKAIRWAFQTTQEITEVSPATNLVFCDIDSDEIGDQTIDDVKAVLSQFPWIFAVWESYGGKGVGFLVCSQISSPGVYAQKYFRISHEILAHTGMLLDPACAEPSRRCVMPSDPKIYINQTPTWFDFQEYEKKVYDSKDNVFKEFNKSYDAQEMCVQAFDELGWEHVGKGRYCRPGKQKGISAVINTENKGRWPLSIHVFTSSDGIIPDGHYDFSEFICVTKFGGNKTEFTKFLYGLLAKNTSSAGQKTSLPKLNFTGATSPPKSDDRLERIVEILSETRASEDKLCAIQWDSVLPEFTNICRELTNTTGFFIEFFASSILFAVSSATCGRLTLEVSTGYYRKPNFWVVNCATAGDAKSPVSKITTKVLFNFQKKLIEKYEVELSDYNAQVEFYADLSKKEREVTGIVSKPVQNPPKRPIFLMTSGTTEGLVSALGNSTSGAVAGYYDEFMGLFNNLNAYKGGKGGDKQTLLSLHGCDPIQKVNVSGTIYVETPYVPLHGTAVFDTIVNFFRKDDNSNNGLYERFAIALPIERLERYHIPRASRKNAPVYEYERTINNILEYFHSLQTELIISYPPELELQIDEIERVLQNLRIGFKNSNQHSMASLYAKIETLFHKITPLFWAFRNFYNSTTPTDFCINIDDLNSSIAMLYYFISTQTLVHDKIFGGVDYTELDGKNLSEYKENLVNQIFKIEPTITGKECEMLIERLTPSSKKTSYTVICRWLKSAKEVKNKQD